MPGLVARHDCRLVGLYGDNFCTQSDIPKRAPNTHQRSARTNAHDECADPAVHLSDDLRAGRRFRTGSLSVGGATAGIRDYT
jgi:hypothetical protein